jgi:hypothetical protein
MSFVSFNGELINRLASGSIKVVRLFGDGIERPKAPYVVAKPIAGGDRKILQILVHVGLGMQDTLEAYIFRELPALLKEPLEAGGKRVTFYSTGAWTGPYIDEGDNTLAMSRDFYVPVII